MTALVDHRSHNDNNGRWTSFRFREGDVVVSTCSKHGTTWMQMILAQLAELSPSLDDLVEPLDGAVSLYHHNANLDRRHVAELTGIPQPDADRPPSPLGDWLRAWIESTATPRQALEPPAGVFWHLTHPPTGADRVPRP